MNKEEFNDDQLEQLLNELRDIENYKGFKDGSWKYELGYYQGLLIIDKINQLQQRLDKVIIILNQFKHIDLMIGGRRNISIIDEAIEILKGNNEKQI